MGSKKHKKQKTENRISECEDGTAPEKPLKLVLNLKAGIGSSQDSVMEEPTSPASEERRHKHKKKKKKKSAEKERSRYVDNQDSFKRQREEDDSGDENEPEMHRAEEEPVAMDSDRITDHEIQQEELSPGRKLREPRSCTVRDSDGYVLRQMLNYLLKTLQNKDVNGFFAFPVTDNIAPGYSSIIIHPMDFSTMASKIESGDYMNVMELKKDFTLMCNNAMTYNRAETIFYKEAKRLLQLGIRALSKEKLLHLKKTHSFMATISLQELGFDESGHMIQIESRVPPAQDEANVKLEENIKQEEDGKKGDFESQEEMEAANILIQAQEAARQAKNKLVARKPKTDFGFLRMNENGTTSMTILNPWNDGVVSSKQRVISLGDYMGKLKNGTGSLFKHKEDKRNRVDTETYLCYGPFSSHAPAYDSSFASCTKEESDLLLNTYGGEVGVQYAKSVQKFVENSGSSAVEMVDKLLDTLTNGQHSKAIVLHEQQKRREEEQIQKALQDEMIAKAQQAADEAEAEAAKDKVQHNLNETAALISELSQTQNERLSRDLPPHISSIAPPSNMEARLADQVSNSLVRMARQVIPKDVVSTSAVRGAMGITTYPVVRPSDLGSGEEQDIDDGAGKSGNKGSSNTPYSSGDDSDESDSDDDDDDGSDDNDGPESGDGGAIVPESMDDDNSDLECNAGFGDL